jgi:thiol-disulfide isomerase/thioredoxin
MFFLFATPALSVNFGPHVTAMTTTRFELTIDKRDNKTVWFVMFHGAHCPACQQAYPEFIRASKEGLGLVNFAQVDAGNEPRLAQRFRISSIPTFYIFYPGKHTLWRDRPDARTMLNAAARWLPDLTEPVDETWANDPNLKAAILFTEKEKSPPIWAGISCNFSQSEIRIGKTTDHSLLRQFGVKKLPTILMVDGEKRITYGGKVAFYEVHQTIKKFFEGEVTPTPKPTPRPIKKIGEQLTDIAVFNKECKGKGVFCVVEGANEVPARLEAVAQMYRRDKFRFFACGEKCPIEYAKKGVWIFHPKKESAIYLESTEGIEGTLDRVIDGGAPFKPLSELAGAAANAGL